MKKRRFADGGDVDSPVKSLIPELGFDVRDFFPKGPGGVNIDGTGSGGGSAQDGLNTINSGSQQVGMALGNASSALSSAQNAIGGGGGGLSGGKVPGVTIGDDLNYGPSNQDMSAGGAMKQLGFKKGGSVPRRIDGIAQRGKTRGRYL
jgi:hypothetical protein